LAQKFGQNYASRRAASVAQLDGARGDAASTSFPLLRSPISGVGQNRADGCCWRSSGQDQITPGRLRALQQFVTWHYRPRPLGPVASGQFSSSDPARVRRILAGAGFCDAAPTPLDLSFYLRRTRSRQPSLRPSSARARDCCTVCQMKRGRPPRIAFQGNLPQHEGPKGVSLPGALWLVSARARAITNGDLIHAAGALTG
jgi:hypothetical protein